MTVMGEVHYPLPILKEKNPLVELTRMYLNSQPTDAASIDEFDGGYVIMTRKSIMSVRFDSHIYFFKTFDNIQLQKILILYEKYLLVQFKDEKFFEIYDFLTGHLVMTQNFDVTIRNTLCTTNNEFLIEFNNNLSCTDVLVAFEKGEFQMISFDGRDLQINILYRILPSGIEFYDFCFEDNHDPLQNNNRILVTFLDGGVCIIENYEIHGEIFYLYPKIEDKNEPIPLKIQTFIRNGALLIDKSGNLVLMKTEDFHRSKIRTIPGNFQIARLCNDMIAAASFGTIYCYYIKNSVDNEMHSVYLYTKIVAHVDSLIHLVYSGN